MRMCTSEKHTYTQEPCLWSCCLFNSNQRCPSLDLQKDFFKPEVSRRAAINHAKNYFAVESKINNVIIKLSH